MNGRSALYFQILRLENTKSHFFYIVLKPPLAGCMRLPVQTDDYGAVPWILTSSQTTTPWGPCWSDTPLTGWSSSTNIRNIKTSSALTVMSFAFLVGKFCFPVTGQDTAVRKTKESLGNSSPAECWPTTALYTPSVRSVVVGSQISPQGLFHLDLCCVLQTLRYFCQARRGPGKICRSLDLSWGKLRWREVGPSETKNI